MVVQSIGDWEGMVEGVLVVGEGLVHPQSTTEVPLNKVPNPPEGPATYWDVRTCPGMYPASTHKRLRQHNIIGQGKKVLIITMSEQIS